MALKMRVAIKDTIGFGVKWLGPENSYYFQLKNLLGGPMASG